MAQYWEDWSGQTVGNEPTGWTKRWVTSGVTVAVQNDASAPGGKSVRITKSSTGRFALTFDAVDSDANRAKVKIKALIRVSDPGANTQSCGGPLVRASGAAGAEYGYQYVCGRDSSANRSRTLNRYVNNAAAAVTTGTANLYAYGTPFWATLEADGSSLRMSRADAGTPETETANTATDSNVSAAGWVGIFYFHTVAFDILAVGVGTNGDDAPTEEPVVDTTAPSLSGASGTKTGATSATGAVTTDEANGTLYAVATTSSTKPSAAQVKAGQDHNGSAAAWADDVAVSSTGEKSFSITGLSASTSYYVHFMHEDAAANQSTVASSSSFTTDTPDTTAPTLSSPSATATSDTTASASVSTNEATGTLYYLASENATETASAVKAASSQSVTGTGSQSVSLTGLTADTAYYVHFVHRDAAGNDSAVATSAQITTYAAPSALAFVFTEDSLNANPTGSSITDETGSTPTVIIKPRIQRIIDDGGDRSRWRQIYAKFTGAAGKRPLFKAVKADYFYGSITDQWKPWYSYDNETWHRFPTPTVGATYLEFQLASAFTGRTVYVSFQPGYPYQRTKDFVAEIAASCPALVHQLPSAGTNHVIDILSNQTNELSQTVTGQPFYGFGVWSPDFDSRTPQRAVVLTAAVHPGEHVADWAFEGFVRYLLSDDSKAVQLRSKYQFLIYPNINPMGRYGGSHVRGQWDSASLYKNANRDFGTDVDAFQLESSQVLRDALTLDAADREVACSLDFHGQQDDPTGKPIAYWFVNAATADATLRAAFEDRMQTYNDAYFERESSAGDSACTSYMQREWGSRHAYSPEGYEQHSAPGGTAGYMLFGEHLAKTLADSLADMVLDGAYPIIDAAITLDFPDTAPCSLLGYQVWSKLTVTDEEITALWSE